MLFLLQNSMSSFFRKCPISILSHAQSPLSCIQMIRRPRQLLPTLHGFIVCLSGRLSLLEHSVIPTVPTSVVTTAPLFRDYRSRNCKVTVSVLSSVVAALAGDDGWSITAFNFDVFVGWFGLSASKFTLNRILRLLGGSIN